MIKDGIGWRCRRRRGELRVVFRVVYCSGRGRRGRGLLRKQLVMRDGGIIRNPVLCRWEREEEEEAVDREGAAARVSF